MVQSMRRGVDKGAASRTARRAWRLNQWGWTSRSTGARTAASTSSRAMPTDEQNPRSANTTSPDPNLSMIRRNSVRSCGGDAACVLRVEPEQAHLLSRIGDAVQHDPLVKGERAVVRQRVVRAEQQRELLENRRSDRRGKAGVSPGHVPRRKGPASSRASPEARSAPSISDRGTLCRVSNTGRQDHQCHSATWLLLPRPQATLGVERDCGPGLTSLCIQSIGATCINLLASGQQSPALASEECSS